MLRNNEDYCGVLFLCFLRERANGSTHVLSSLAARSQRFWKSRSSDRDFLRIFVRMSRPAGLPLAFFAWAAFWRSSWAFFPWVPSFVIVEPPNVCTPRWTINSLSTTPIFFVLSPWKQYKKKQVYLESSPKRSRSCLDSEVMNLELLQYGLKDVRCLRT